jgi:protein-tyrosine phosphatase
VVVKPIHPTAMASVPGLDTPQRFYQVLRDPAPFAGMSFPDGEPWESLASVGFRSVVCLTDDVTSYDPHPLEVLRSANLKDLAGGRQPDDPHREAAVLRDIVQAVVCELQAGRGVVVHCVGGTGRTGTIIGCSLRALGLTVEDVLAYMTIVNRERQKYPGWKGWPESDWQRRQVADYIVNDV